MDSCENGTRNQYGGRELTFESVAYPLWVILVSEDRKDKQERMKRKIFHLKQNLSRRYQLTVCFTTGCSLRGFKGSNFSDPGKSDSTSLELLEDIFLTNEQWDILC
jgi:hypothetical protein